MTNEQIWNCDRALADVLDIDVPAWIDADISPSTIASICQGGCASGAYMPAVTYHKAIDTMAEHGDDVLAYIEWAFEYIPQPERGEGWGQLACRYLSTAVELWAADMLARLEDVDLEGVEA